MVFSVTSLRPLLALRRPHCNRAWLSTGTRLCRASAGRYRVTRDHSFPLTYEMAMRPEEIGEKKAHNSMNTGQLEGTFLHKEEIGQDLPHKLLFEDMFVRKFLHGTWPEMISSEVIIKRQHNLVRIAFAMVLPTFRVKTSNVYFLIGYTEEILSYWLKCPVKLEIQMLADKSELIYKYI